MIKMYVGSSRLTSIFTSMKTKQKSFSTYSTKLKIHMKSESQ